MAQIGPEANVSPPPLVAGRGGLLPTLRALGLVEEADRVMDWEMGITYKPDGCGTAKLFAPCSDDTKTVDPQAADVISLPFAVYADDGCSTFGYQSNDYDERVRKAKLNLSLMESNAIADELWTGAKAAAEGWPNPSLAGSSTALLPIGINSPYRLALGALQDALADCLGDGQAGIIWATRTTVTTWWQTGSICWDNERGVLHDIHGNIVISSGGFDGSDPAGGIDDTAPWAYATGSAFIRLGQVTDVTQGKVADALNRATNDIDVFVERLVVIDFDTCCAFGIGVSLCCNNCDPDYDGGST